MNRRDAVAGGSGGGALAPLGVLDLALLVGAKIAVGAFVLHAGFSHVSDDDYARVVIAEQLAHAPRLDPSGTSWLPFPFWVNGLAMMALGRSLGVARAVAFALGALSPVPPYLAMRAVGCARAAALVATGVAMMLPWSAWLGVATVPEATTDALVAAAAIATTSARARPWAAAGLLAASLSRYEAWPVCAVFAVACAVYASRARDARSRGRDVVAAAVAALGPLAWMAWNAHAHGSALHFVARVAAYRRAIGAADAPLAEKVLGFPRALVTTSPLVACVAAAGLVALATEREVRGRWAWPLACAAASLAFLVYGDLRDGAPTHHPERAVLAIVGILAAFGVDALHALAGRLRPGPRRHLRPALAVALVAWGVTLPPRWRDYPARAADESRDAQVERGARLPLPPEGTRVVLTPCAYEHFALMAASGAPERFDVVPGPRAPVTPDCPRVEYPSP